MPDISLFQRALNTIPLLLSQDPSIVLAWPDTGPVRDNWGDKLNPYVVGRLSGRPVVNASAVLPPLLPKIYFGIGSSLRSVKGRNKSVYGTGFISKDDKVSTDIGDIRAVRGHLSKAKLAPFYDVSGVAIGDAALLMPLLHTPQPRARHRIGLIPHFKERDMPIWLEHSGDEMIKIIDITGGIEDFCDDVASCDVIVSSSLHGAILAHSYGIPAQLVAVSDRPLGDGFKFLDYLSSVGLDDSPPIVCRSSSDIISVANNAPRPRHLPSIERLLMAAPFLSSAVAEELAPKVAAAYQWASFSD